MLVTVSSKLKKATEANILALATTCNIKEIHSFIVEILKFYAVDALSLPIKGPAQTLQIYSCLVM